MMLLIVTTASDVFDANRPGTKPSETLLPAQDVAQIMAYGAFFQKTSTYPATRHEDFPSAGRDPLCATHTGWGI